MKLLHYIALNQSTTSFIQRLELICIAKEKEEGGGEKCLSKWIFFQYLLVVNISVDSPFSIPTQVEVLDIHGKINPKFS